MGEITFLGAVYMANLKIATFSNSFSRLQVFMLVGSVLSSILVWFSVSHFTGNVLERTFWSVFGSIQVYVYLLLLTAFALADWAIHKAVGRLR